MQREHRSSACTSAAYSNIVSIRRICANIASVVERCPTRAPASPTLHLHYYCTTSWLWPSQCPYCRVHATHVTALTSEQLHSPVKNDDRHVWHVSSRKARRAAFEHAVVPTQLHSLLRHGLRWPRGAFPSAWPSTRRCGARVCCGTWVFTTSGEDGDCLFGSGQQVALLEAIGEGQAYGTQWMACGR